MRSENIQNGNAVFRIAVFGEDSKPIKSIGSVARDDPYGNIPLAEYFDQTTASHSFEKPGARD